MGNIDSRAVKVLVVDDDQSTRELLCLHLRNDGYQVVAAADAVIAGRALFTSLPDVMVVDIEMPYLSGIEFVSIMLADTTLPSIPVIFISAHEQYREHAEALGMVFLRKPIQKHQLLEAVASIVVNSKISKAGAHA